MYLSVLMMTSVCGVIGYCIPRKRWSKKNVAQRMSLVVQLLAIPLAVAALALVLLLDRRAASRRDCWDVLRDVIPDFGDATTMVYIALSTVTAGLLFGAVHAMLSTDAMRLRRWTTASTASAAFLSALAVPGALYQMFIADSAMRICS